MSSYCLQDLVDVTSGKLDLGLMPPVKGPLTPLGRVVLDCRQIRPGDVYWCLDGDPCATNEAFARQAMGVVSAGHKSEPWAGRFHLQVEHAANALERWSCFVRNRFSGHVVAVAGYTGKTTTAHWLQAVLSSRWTGLVSGHATPDHASTHNTPTRDRLSGVDQASRSAFSCEQAIVDLALPFDYGVFELNGMNAESLAAQTARISPRALVVTNLDERSAASRSSRAAVRLLESLRASLPPSSWLVVNGDDPLLCQAARTIRSQVITVGRGGHCDLVANSVGFSAGHLVCEIDGLSVRAPACGRHQLVSLLAAFAVGRLVGIPAAELTQSLQTFEPPSHACHVIRRDDAVVMADWPQGRPAAALAALDALRDCAATGRRVVVCGNVLGNDPRYPEHARSYGDAVVTRCGADLLISFGPVASELIDAARLAGLGPRRSVACDSASDAAQVVRSVLAPGDAVLVTGETPTEISELLNALVAVRLPAAA